MKQMSEEKQQNTDQIELHLQSAVDALIPNVFDRIDLSVAQDAVSGDQIETTALPDSAESKKHQQSGSVLILHRHMRSMALAAAACLCLVISGGGALHYQYQNRQVDSVIGIDVNPSVELSINRKNRVLSAEALNEDAEAILSDMDLKGTELNVAVNAVIGAMVTEGYLDDLDNAILVTVSNDSIRKASELRTSVVGDVEKTLEENQVQAVVYDQQVIEKDEMKTLAEEYGISYGKAYFLKELIEQNQNLTMDDMKELSSMTMEEIARRIADNSLALGEFADQVKEPETTTVAATTEPETELVETESTEVETTTATETTAVETSAAETTAAPTTTAAVTEEEEEQEDVQADRVKIDYVDYDDGLVYVYFVTKVKWKNPTVSVTDEEGNSYAAYVEDTDRDECTISVSGLEGGKSYSFVLGGLTPREGGNATTVKGYFEKPEIAGELTGEEETEKETTAAATKESAESKPSETETAGVSGNTESTAETSETTEKPSHEETKAAADTTAAADISKTAEKTDQTATTETSDSGMEQ